MGAVAVGLAADRWSAAPATAVSTATAVGVLVWGLLRLPGSGRLIGPPTAAAGAVSLLATGLSAWPSGLPFAWSSAVASGAAAAPGMATASGAAAERADAAWKLLGVGVLLALIAATVRWAPRRPAVAAGATAGAACGLWVVPYLEADLMTRIGACLSWLLIVAVVAAGGAYPRWTAQRQREAVAAARREQQLVLARDLHDFVAHDISGIVVQAQAARFVAAANPAQALAALERIEAAGLHALAAMDRTVQMLHERGPAERRQPPTVPATAFTGPPGIAQLPDLVERFTAAGATVARLDIAPGVAETLSPEAGTTAYRVVVEALNNVRRHAPGAKLVEVELRLLEGESVQVMVVNGAGAGGAPSAPGLGLGLGLGRRERGRGGRGLRELAAQVRSTGGEFSAGPTGPTGTTGPGGTGGTGEAGWRVVAEIGGRRG
ncbi:putative two-component system sensor kinase [Kitasatospora setae KM-6054]|uniref:histidine kinase n=1 Tax=Kitasatospora setae (strain ATCC 33774 / DSM 43861 / JCM 3304 / KCC A-0304 / NBRC 14216 / KM-6054) TaxID=452652 RepID=E4N5T7_KITSK|nr:putative two-component system sensor kinase [Kitasatospora setae KM-6054]